MTFKFAKKPLALATSLATAGLMSVSANVFAAGHGDHGEPSELTKAITGGTAFGDIRLRFEDVETGAGADTNALYLRSRIGYKTAGYHGFSALVEFEDNRDVLGIAEDDPNQNLILDAEFTELDQGFIHYKNDIVTAKLGRQVITHDGHRHVGHVGWRNDRQTFDAGRVVVKPVEGLTLDFAHVYRVNRINSPVFGDLESASHNLVNISYKSPIGKIGAYYYDLSEEVGGAGFDETQTTGAFLKGKAGDDLKVLYHLEYAKQDNDTEGTDADYTFVELGLSGGGITGKIGYEVLGSDDGIATFSTPLATVHKFNGWADVFAAPSLFGTLNGGNGLVDTYVSISGKPLGIKLAAIYHEYETDEGSTDIGDEINLLAAKKISKNYSVGLKYADFSSDAGSAGDKEVLWGWVGMKF